MLSRLTAVIVLVVIAPAYLLIAIAIKLCNEGAVLYRAQRLGLNGKPFSLLKFRTMKENSPAVVVDLKSIVAERDPRITFIGRWLRCGLDELPQLVNVIRGEMVWIGPRPDESWMINCYGPASRQRLRVKPGITGLAQVLDSRNLPISEVYALDLWFVENRNLIWDIVVLALTPLYVFGFRFTGCRLLNHLRNRPDFLQWRSDCEMELSHSHSCQ